MVELEVRVCAGRERRKKQRKPEEKSVHRMPAHRDECGESTLFARGATAVVELADFDLVVERLAELASEI